MCDPIQSIATRLRGLREALELTQEEVAASCNLPVGQYREMESGTADFSVNVLQTISRHYGISLDVLMFGEEPKMNAYFITRAGKGVHTPPSSPVRRRCCGPTTRAPKSGSPLPTSSAKATARPRISRASASERAMW